MVQQLLGHEDISVTQEWYAQYDTEQIINSSKDVNKTRVGVLKKFSIAVPKSMKVALIH